MSASYKIRYTKALDGTEAEVNATLSLDRVRLTTETGPQDVPVIRASQGSRQIILDASGIVDKLLDGRPSSPPDGLYAIEAAVAVTAGDPVALTDAEMVLLGSPTSSSGFLLVMQDNAGTGMQKAIVSTVDALGTPPRENQITVYGERDGSAVLSGFESDIKVGDIILFVPAAYVLANLISSSLAEDSGMGLKAYLEQPAAVTFTVAQAAGDQILVTITESSDTEVTHYDVYVKDSYFSEIEGSEQPDIADIASSSFSSGSYEGYASTYRGGANTRNGGNLVSGSAYYVSVVAKTGSGKRNINEGRISTPQSITLD